MNQTSSKLPLFLLIFLSTYVLFYTTCINKNYQTDTPHKNIYTNPIKEKGIEPWAIFHEGEYFYTEGYEDRIKLWRTKDLTDISNAESIDAWLPKDKSNAYHLWGPEIHFINNKWYIYFAADDGYTDNHQIYVVENQSPNPFEGEFIMKGRIQTDKDNNWAIHADVFQHQNELYMIW